MGGKKIGFIVVFGFRRINYKFTEAASPVAKPWQFVATGRISKQPTWWTFWHFWHSNKLMRQTGSMRPLVRLEKTQSGHQKAFDLQQWHDGKLAFLLTIYILLHYYCWKCFFFYGFSLCEISVLSLQALNWNALFQV